MHDQLRLIDDLIVENEELRKLATLDVTNPVDASLAAEERNSPQVGIGDTMSTKPCTDRSAQPR